MPIYAGTSNKNQQAISVGGRELGRVWVGDKLVWEKKNPVVIKFGLLYNPYAVMDARNIAAAGWHVPTRAEVTALITYCGANPARKLKDTNPIYWTTDIGNTNEYKLNIRNSGYRTIDGVAHYNDHHSWCLMGTETLRIAYWALGGGISYIPNDWTYLPNNQGYSLHLLKNATTLAHGQEGTYIGNNGVLYKTICIGNQEWLAESLCETKFRTGEIIAEIQDNTAWGAATIPALCALNNDWTNVKN